jgi:DNA-binding transcriptional MerR regulator
MNGKERISIGDLAKGTGTKVVTVRYYEQIGLLPVPISNGRKLPDL